MNHLRTLGVVALALAAFTAFVGVSSASAKEFHASVASASLTGSQATSHKFTVTGSSITCTTATFTGTASNVKTSETQEMHPEYSGCTAFGFVGATINTAGCQYLFNANKTTVDLKSCTGGATGAIVVTASSAFGKCVMEVPNQTGINGQSFTTQGTSPNRDILVTSNSNNIKDSVTLSTGICPLTVGSHTNGTYTGTTTVKAATGEVWWE
jgi:hypothetical protein